MELSFGFGDRRAVESVSGSRRDGIRDVDSRSVWRFHIVSSWVLELLVQHVGQGDLSGAVSGLLRGAGSQGGRDLLFIPEVVDSGDIGGVGGLHESQGNGFGGSRVERVLPLIGGAIHHLVRARAAGGEAFIMARYQGRGQVGPIHQHVDVE